MSMKRPSVLLTNPIHPVAHERLARHVDVVVAPATDTSSLIQAIANVDGLIVRAHLPEDIFEHQRQLKAVVRHGVGLDMIPVDRATEAGIPVANLPGCNTSSVVEYCLNMMLNFSRPVGVLSMAVDGADWVQRRDQAASMRELNGMTLGVVGVGTIGGQLARVAMALGMDVIAVTRTGKNLPKGVQAVTLFEACRQADFIVLSCPLTAETRGLISAATLAETRDGALLINVSRGPVVDRQAVIDALRAGKLAGAVMDVHDEQPIPSNLYPDDVPGLVLTPHVAGITQTSLRRMSEESVDEMLRMLQGKNPKNLVNPLYKTYQ